MHHRCKTTEVGDDNYLSLSWAYCSRINYPCACLCTTLLNTVILPTDDRLSAVTSRPNLRVYFKDFLGLHNTPLPSPYLPSPLLPSPPFPVLSSPRLPSRPLPSPPSPPLPLEVGPLNPARWSGGALYAPPAGSGAEPQAKLDFGAF